MIYLIGVSHLVQHRNPDMSIDPMDLGIPEAHRDLRFDAVQHFQDHLEHAAIRFNAHLIAEELAMQTVRDNNVSESTAQIVCEKLQIGHKFCDPDMETRVQHAITTDAERERFWMKQLNSEARDQNILFICGWSHLESFMTLLQNSGFDVIIESERWGEDIQSLRDDEWNKYLGL